MPNVGSQTPEMAEEEEVTEVLVLSWLSIMQTRIADLHYAVSQTKIIAPALSGIKIQHPVLSMHLKKCWWSSTGLNISLKSVLDLKGQRSVI